AAARLPVTGRTWRPAGFRGSVAGDSDVAAQVRAECGADRAAGRASAGDWPSCLLPPRPALAACRLRLRPSEARGEPVEVVPELLDLICGPARRLELSDAQSPIEGGAELRQVVHDGRRHGDAEVGEHGAHILGLG